MCAYKINRRLTGKLKASNNNLKCVPTVRKITFLENQEMKPPSALVSSRRFANSSSLGGMVASRIRPGIPYSNAKNLS